MLCGSSSDDVGRECSNQPLPADRCPKVWETAAQLSRLHLPLQFNRCLPPRPFDKTLIAPTDSDLPSPPSSRGFTALVYLSCKPTLPTSVFTSAPTSCTVIKPICSTKSDAQKLQAHTSADVFLTATTSTSPQSTSVAPLTTTTPCHPKRAQVGALPRCLTSVVHLMTLPGPWRHPFQALLPPCLGGVAGLLRSTWFIPGTIT